MSHGYVAAGHGLPVLPVLPCLLWAVVGVACSGKGVDSGDVGSDVTDPLVLDHQAWALDTSGADPFAADRPADVADCPPSALRTEGGFFEVDTDTCLWGSFSQAVRIDIAAGEQLRFVFWHLDTWAPEPTTAHIALQLDDTLVWEHFEAVPGGEGTSEVFVELDGAVVAGAPAWFHVSNHGTNSWRISDVAVWEPVR